jgi:hypothetical protein
LPRASERERNTDLRHSYFDKELQDQIIARLHEGGCSYRDTAEFIQGGYWQDMRHMGKRTMKIDSKFSREELKRVHQDVRSYQPWRRVRLKDAWVWNGGNDLWAFHYGEFYWWGRASNAYDARAKGWCAWLTQKGAKGYDDTRSTEQRA